MLSTGFSSNFTIHIDKLKECLLSNYEKINGYRRTDMIQNVNVSYIPQYDIRITLVFGGSKQ